LRKGVEEIMHYDFIPYGKRSEVELLLRDMEAQKFPWIFKKGDEQKIIYIQGSVRILPGGCYEYVFPKESLDLVCATLTEGNNPYNVPAIGLIALKKMLRLTKIPKYNKEKYFLWIHDNVAIIPLGIREDGEVTEPPGTLHAGFTHEEL
jgi:hypothetical protein